MGDVSLKGLRKPEAHKDSDWVYEFASSDPRKPSIKIKSIHIHHTSHIFEKDENYVGLMVYLCDDKNDFILNNVGSQIGDIYIKRSSWIFENTPKYSCDRDYVHARLFYSIFGCWKKKEFNFVGAGFSYHDGQWKFNSGTLNTMNSNNGDDTYHDTDRKLSIFEQKIIRTMCHHFYENHEWLAMAPDERVASHALKQLWLAREKRLNCVTDDDISEVDSERRLRGKVRWFDCQKGYGFIGIPGFPEDIFVHHSAIVNITSGRTLLKHNEDVEFHVIRDDRGWQARQLTRIGH